jgi:hypothetical protein
LAHPALLDPAEATRVRRVDMPAEDDCALPLSDGKSFVARDYFGDCCSNQLGPQAFLVEAPGGIVVGAHFHPTDQFQIFFPTEGAWYRKQDISEVMIHFADAYVTYGPFGTRGAQPLHFYTLRAASSLITAFMPQDREKLIRRGRRNYTVLLDDSVVPVLPVADESAVSTLMGPESDGLAAYLVSVGPAAKVDVIPELPAESAGQFYCVVDGSTWNNGQQFAARSLGWRGSGMPPPSLTADEHAGCRLLVLQMPHPTAPRHPGEENSTSLRSQVGSTSIRTVRATTSPN